MTVPNNKQAKGETNDRHQTFTGAMGIAYA